MSDHALYMKRTKLSEARKIWEGIFNSTPNRGPFLSYDWFASLAANLLKTDPEILVFWKNDSAVAILPVMNRDGKFVFVSDERVTDVCDLLCTEGYEKEVVEEFAARVKDNGWSFDLFPLESESSLVRFAPGIIQHAVLVDADLSPVLTLPDSWEEYLGMLDGKQRHELRRKLRKAAQVTLKKASFEQMGVLFTLMAASSKEKCEFLTSEMKDFFSDIAKAFSEREWLRYRIAYSDSEAIGAVLSFHLNGCVYLYNTGFDPAQSHLAPGIVTIALDIKSSIDEGDRCYDFLRGGEKFKFNLGARERFTKRIRT